MKRGHWIACIACIASRIPLCFESGFPRGPLGGSPLTGLLLSDTHPASHPDRLPCRPAKSQPGPSPGLPCSVAPLTSPRFNEIGRHSDGDLVGAGGNYRDWSHSEPLGA
jgi:hypothetical protein